MPMCDQKLPRPTLGPNLAAVLRSRVRWLPLEPQGRGAQGWQSLWGDP
jgi:hypothetical protein